MQSEIVHKWRGPICGETLASCTCGEPPAHSGPHVCNEPDRCLGSWKGTGGELDEVISWPINGVAGPVR